MTGRAGFDEFVAGRTTHLLRTAYLVTGDAVRAQALLHSALVRAWSAWPTLETDPESFVRSQIVAEVTARRPFSALVRRGAARWGAGAGAKAYVDRADATGHGDLDPDAADLWRRFQGLEPTLRTRAVLRWFDHVPDDAAQEVLVRLGVEETALAGMLLDRADDVGDGPEPSAIRAAVTATNRRRGRRLAAGSVAAMVVVGLVVAPSVLAGDDETDPPPRRLAGHVVPPTLTSTGFTYEYSQGFESGELDAELVVELPASDEPRLAVWASTAPRIAAFVTATVDGRRRGRHAAGTVEGFEYLPAGTGHEIVVAQEGVGLTERLGVAVYTPSDSSPPGVGDGLTTFREQVLGEDLVAGVVGRRGDRTARVDAQPPAGAGRVAFTCYGSDEHFVRVTVNGAAVGGRRCSRLPVRDAGAAAGPWTVDLPSELLTGSAGDELTLRATLVDSAGRLAEDDDAVVGAALYTDLVPSQTFAGVAVPLRVEMDGHTWTLDGMPFENRRGRAEQLVRAGPGQPATMYAAVVRGSGNLLTPLTWDVRVDTKVVETMTDDRGRGGVTFSPYLVVPEGDHRMLEVAVTAGADESTSVGFVTYHRQDPLP